MPATQQGGYINPAMSAMGGAAQAIAPMTGYTKTPTSMGQVLAALGGGAMQGQNQATQQNLSMQQIQQKMQDAQIARDMAAAQSKALQNMAVKMNLPLGTPQEVILERMKASQAAGKFGEPKRVVNPDSSTGYSLMQIAQDGTTRIVGEAAPPTPQFDPNEAKNKGRYAAAFGRYEEAMSQVNSADKIVGDVRQMMDLVNRVDTGTFAETRLGLQKMLAAAGVDVDMSAIADAEALRSKGMDFILQRISQTKGAISEKEMAAFEAASAGIKNTPEGNRMILELARKVALRQRAEAQAVREAYTGDNTAKELDDIRLRAREAFGSIVPDRSELAVPAGVDPAIWDYMTDEERAKFRD